jgi:hypothetical protein
MLTSEKILFDKFSKLARNVKQDFRNKGIVLPSKLQDGSIQVGTYLVTKKDSFFYVKDKNNLCIAGPLNLAKTAIVIANDLALGRALDYNLVERDKWYGYKLFDEQTAIHVADRARKDRDYDRSDYSLYKASLAAEKKKSYKRDIDLRFNKLYKIS